MIDSEGSLWEERLAKVAKNVAYPITPDVWPRVKARMFAAPKLPARPRLRWGAVLAVLMVALLGGLMAAPAARAAVFRVLRIGVVRIFLEPTSSPVAATPIASPGVSPTPVLSPPLDLLGLTSPAEAEEDLGFPLPLPSYPPDLGEPDLVFSQFIEGPLAIMVWLDPEDPTRARLALHVLGPETFAGKSEARLIEETSVHGAEALWLVGSHFLLLRNGSTEFRALVTGHVLLWSAAGLTYRLETDQPLEEAVRIAESIR